MFWIYIGGYTAFLLFSWGFFIVAKIYAYKFKTFSHNIQIVTNIMLVILITLSLLGYINIILNYQSDSGALIEMKDSSNYSEIDY